MAAKQAEVYIRFVNGKDKLFKNVSHDSVVIENNMLKFLISVDNNKMLYNCHFPLEFLDFYTVRKV